MLTQKDLKLIRSIIQEELEIKLKPIEEDIVYLKEKVDKLEAKVKNIEIKLSKLESKVDKLEDRIDYQTREMVNLFTITGDIITDNLRRLRKVETIIQDKKRE